MPSVVKDNKQNKGIIQSILLPACTCTSRSAFGHYADGDVVSSWRDDLVSQW